MAVTSAAVTRNYAREKSVRLSPLCRAHLRVSSYFGEHLRHVYPHSSAHELNATRCVLQIVDLCIYILITRLFRFLVVPACDARSACRACSVRFLAPLSYRARAIVALVGPYLIKLRQFRIILNMWERDCEMSRVRTNLSLIPTLYATSVNIVKRVMLHIFTLNLE